jgi:hypothetical protein
MQTNSLTKAMISAAAFSLEDCSNSYLPNYSASNDPDYRGFAHGNRRRNRLKRLARNARQRNRRK